MANKQTPADSSATALGVLALFFWSMTIGVSRSLTEKIGTFTAASLIFLIGGALSCLVLAVTDAGSFRAIFRLPRKVFAGLGTLCIAYMVCLYSAVGLAGDHIALLGVGLVQYLWPTVLIIFTVFLLKYRIGPGLAPGILLATLGTALAVTGSTELTRAAVAASARANAPAFLFALGAAVSWGWYSAGIRRYGAGLVSGIPVYLFLSGIVLGLIRLGLPETSHWNGRAVAELSFMALLPAALAYNLWEIGIRRGNFVLLSTLSYLTPVVSTLISCLYLEIVPGARIWVGSVFVALGAYICKRSVREV